MPPKVIGPYRVLETLGSGGVGTVYRAVDRRSGEDIALKLLSTGPALDPRAARRLAREFETLSDLSHPNVVKVFDTGVFQGYPYLAMELVEGLTLRHYLAMSEEEESSRAGPRARMLDPYTDDSYGSGSCSYNQLPFNLSAFAEESPSEEVNSGPESLRALADIVGEPDTLNSNDSFSMEVSIPAAEQAIFQAPNVDLLSLNRPHRIGRLRDAMLQLCKALAYIHAHGLVHRDLKPSNIMVDEERTVRLMDFGLAKFLADDAAVTADGRLVGTFRYMSPEQILGEKLDARADLYSLGVILYELLSGRAPYDARTPYELWQKVLETEAPPIITLNQASDDQLARIAHRLIRKDPEDRFQTAEEVYDALTEY